MSRMDRLAVVLEEHAVPVLPARDLHETLAFYERLGFVLQGAPIEQYRYLIIARGSIEMHFFEQPGVDPLATDAGCYVRVRDADALHREWKALGVPADPATGSRLMGVTDTDYGSARVRTRRSKRQPSARSARRNAAPTRL